MSAVIDYRRKIYATRDLPTLPIIAQRILTLTDDDETGTEALAKIIASDQALTVRILSLANSAYYGHRAQIATLWQAIVVIGWTMLKQVSLSVLICKALGPGGNRAPFWRHSLMAANAAASAATRAGAKNAEAAYVAGLLHDVGKVILDVNLPQEYAEVRQRVDRDHCSFVEAEQSVFQTDHVEVGAWMAERWQLPPELVSAIALHHTPEIPAEQRGPHSKFIAAVYASNALVEAANQLAEKPDQPLVIELPEPIQTALGIPQTGLVQVATELQAKRKQIEQLLL
jgi:putative nucleotidyltransferase with HDIG domain